MKEFSAESLAFITEIEFWKKKFTKMANKPQPSPKVSDSLLKPDAINVEIGNNVLIELPKEKYLHTSFIHARVFNCSKC